MNWDIINNGRISIGPFATDKTDGFNGASWIRLPNQSKPVLCIFSDGMGWKHVSVSYGANSSFTPSWETMCQIKDLFFEPEDCVVQFHPAKSQYRNFHPGCLHLWKPDCGMPVPDPLMVAPDFAVKEPLTTDTPTTTV